MKVLRDLLIILTAVFILVVFSLHLFINVKGKSLLINELKQVFNEEVSIEDFKVVFPFRFIIKDIRIGDSLKIGEARGTGVMVDIFKRSFGFSRLDLKRLSLKVEKSAQGPGSELKEKSASASSVVETVPVDSKAGISPETQQTTVSTEDKDQKILTEEPPVSKDVPPVESEEPDVSAQGPSADDTEPSLKEPDLPDPFVSSDNTAPAVEISSSPAQLSDKEKNNDSSPAVDAGNETISMPVMKDNITSPGDQSVLLVRHFFLKHLVISESTLTFTDKSIGEAGYTGVIEDLNVDMRNVIFPARKEVITSFEIKGMIPWDGEKEKGGVDIHGWINFFKKDMQATLSVNNIDGLAFFPYYARWVNLEESRIDKVKLNFSSDINGLNNDVTADCRLELTDISFKPREPEEEPKKAEKIAQTILNIFKTMDKSAISFNFTVKTKMDNPEFGFEDIKLAFETKLKQARGSSGISTEKVISLPGKLIEETIKSASDVSKALLEGTLDFGKELKKALEESFRKEPSEEDSEEESE